MINYFKNLYRRIRATLTSEEFEENRTNLVNKLRTVVPLSCTDLEEIGRLLEKIARNKESARSRMNILIEAVRRRSTRPVSVPVQIEGNKKQPRQIDSTRDVSYWVNGEIFYGDVRESEELEYFTEENIRKLNSQRPKYNGARNRRRVSSRVIAMPPKTNSIEPKINEEAPTNFEGKRKADEYEAESLLKRKKPSQRKFKSVITDLNVELGMPRTFGMFIGDEDFTLDQLPEEEQANFLKWQEEQEGRLKLARKTLDLTKPYQQPEVKQEPPVKTVSFAPLPSTSTQEVETAPTFVNPFRLGELAQPTANPFASTSESKTETDAISEPASFSNPFTTTKVDAVKSESDSLTEPPTSTFAAAKSVEREEKQNPFISIDSNPFKVENPFSVDKKKSLENPFQLARKVVPSTAEVPPSSAIEVPQTSSLSRFEPESSFDKKTIVVPEKDTKPALELCSNEKVANPFSSSTLKMPSFSGELQNPFGASQASAKKLFGQVESVNKELKENESEQAAKSFQLGDKSGTLINPFSAKEGTEAPKKLELFTTKTGNEGASDAQKPKNPFSSFPGSSFASVPKLEPSENNEPFGKPPQSNNPFAAPKPNPFEAANSSQFSTNSFANPFTNNATFSANSTFNFNQPSIGQNPFKIGDAQPPNSGLNSRPPAAFNPQQNYANPFNMPNAGSNPFYPSTQGSLQGNPAFTSFQGQSFGTQNPFSSQQNQEEQDSLFNANDGWDDSFRRKRAYRKR